MAFVISLVGRPNVGKSTLFNRLIGRKHAIVENTPGVTRDRREGEGSVGPLEFTVIDTPGLEEKGKDSIETRMMMQTEIAVSMSDLVLMIVDAKEGLNPDDRFFANWLRKRAKNIILIANKSEAKSADIADFYQLGLGEVTPISAEHGEGFADLYEAIAPFEEKYREEYSNIENEDNDDILKIAIVGRPNAGKSTLINQLLGEDRLLTGAEAGITRDSISINWEYKGKHIKLIDTAGMRKKSNIETNLEKLSTADSIRSIKYAHVVVLLVDAQNPLETQDLNIARVAIEEGRAVIIAVNKYDLVKDRSAYKKELIYKAEELLPELKGIRVIFLSALHNENTDKLIEETIALYDIWNMRIETSKLNEWLKRALEEHSLPLSPNGRRVKIKYMTQAKSRPPSFVVFTTYPAEVRENYIRYMVNSLREEFGLPGIPIRMILRKPKNPYSGKK